MSNSKRVSLFLRTLLQDTPLREYLDRELVLDPFTDEMEACRQYAIESCGTTSSTLQQSFKSRKPLISIFNRIYNGKNRIAYPYHPISIEQSEFFPKDEAKALSENTPASSNNHFAQFVSEFDGIVKSYSNDLPKLVDASLPLLRKYLWCVPSGEGGSQYVSAYDSLKMISSIADCMNTYVNENPGKTSIEKGIVVVGPNVFPLLLVGGDISGIQKFIYNVSSHKASVSLKGRSFYLQLLVDKLLDEIVKHPSINVTKAHVVYSSGGKFYLVLPNLPKVVTALNDLRKKFEREIWDEHYGNLGIAIESVAFSMKGVRVTTATQKDVPTGHLWRELAEKLTMVKNHKFSSLIEDSYDSMFEVQAVGGTPKVCAITGIESESCVKLDKESQEMVLPSVKKQVELGIALKDPDYIDKVRSTEKNVFGFSLYGGSSQPINYKGDAKTFEDLADGSWIGILRMDVDGLGRIFIEGLPAQERTFAAYSNLSFMLDWYFSGYINTIRETKEFCTDVSVLYSGGDDVFAIGQWDKTILFAEALRQGFRKLTGREDISISGGVVIVKPKFPIAKAADLAGEAEEEAKSFGNGDKNAFNMFGESISWKDEFDFVKKAKAEILALSEKPYNMPRSILHRIMLYAEMKKRGEIKYLWHSAYYLKRFAEGKDDSIVDFCRHLQTNLFKPARNLDLYSVAARWAELELRD